VTPAFLELKRRTQENLVAFLRIEVELASTFCKLAETTQDPEHRERLLENTQKAVTAVHHLAGRITDAAIRAELNTEADRLGAFAARNSK
jgi:hypothetical protein